MRKPVLTIIIPAYNAEKTLKRAVNSIDGELYEILVVENGSTDHTTETALRLSSEKVGICVLHSEKGVSNARNIGIQAAHGEFITFLDADDYFENGSLQWLIEDLTKLQGKCNPMPDIYVTGLNYKESCEKSKLNNKEDIIRFINACMYEPTRKANNHGIIYSTSFLQKQNILFDTGLRYSEDSEFYIHSLLKANSVIYQNIPFYHVVYNEASTMHNVQHSMMPEYIKSMKKIWDDIVASNCQDKLFNAYQVFVLNQFLLILVHETAKEKDKQTEIIASIRQIAQTEPFQEAILTADVSVCSGASKVVFQLLQKKHYFSVYLAVKLRQAQNKRKSRAI
jgi:glycosyltransferase involved in cell wall biosynthesis